MHIRLVHGLFSLGIVLLCGLAGTWSAHHHKSIDLSESGQNSLAPQSQQALRALGRPLTVIAYVAPNHPARLGITTLVARYQQYAPDMKLIFTDPATMPDVLRAGHLVDGDVVIASDKRREHLSRYTETAFTGALLRLVRQDAQWIAFVAGHGERSPARGTNFDVSQWADTLKSRGYQVRELNLAESGAVPDNTALLVLASPQLAYLPGETNLITAYVAHGGALLWMVEPDTPLAFDTLAHALGFARLPATVIDPQAAALGVHNPAMTVLTHYPAHAVTEGLQALTVLPFAAPLAARPGSGWQASRLLETNDKAWGETGLMSGKIRYDEGQDIPGPMAVGLSLARPWAGHEQRLGILGDGDFLSNTYLGNGANQDLGTRLVDWLVANDAMVQIPSRLAPDVHLDLQRWHQLVIGFGFLVGLPLAFVANGLWLGWRRRRA